MARSLLEALPDFMVQDTEEGDPVSYYGFVEKEGKWYIEQDTAVTDKITTYRFATASNNPSYAFGNYINAWTDRATLQYDYLFQIQI